jgi:di/tricarboxylate transporter
MPTLAKVKNRSEQQYLVITIVSVLFMLCFGYVVPPFATVSALGVKMLGVFIGLLLMTIFTKELIAASLLAMVFIVFHGFYSASDLLVTWLGSITAAQCIFLFAFCGALRETGVMDVIAKKLLTMKIMQGRPVIFMLMIFLTTYIISIFLGGAPAIILMFSMYESIRDVAGIDKHDNLNKFSLLGIYVGAMGSFVLPFVGVQLLTIGMLDSVMVEFGQHFSGGVWVVTQVVVFVLFLIIYTLSLKPIFRCDLSVFTNVDMKKVEKLAQTPDKFTRRMKVMLWTFVVCVLYATVISLLPKTVPGYATITSFSTIWFWILAMVVLHLIHVEGKPYLDLNVTLKNNVMWTLVALLGAFTIIGKVFTSQDLGISSWLASLIQPFFSSMGIWGLVILITLVTTILTQFVNGLVLTLALTPVIMPIACSLASTNGINPSVIGTLISTCANIAFLTYAGSTNAVFILGRDDMTQKFVWTKGVVALILFMVMQVFVAVGLSYAL